MQVAVFSTKRYDQTFLDAANPEGQHDFRYLEERLGPINAILAQGCEAVCLFVNDLADAKTLELLAKQGCKLILLRCAGFNNVDLHAAAALGLGVWRVPAYSPYAVAEHTLAMMLTLNRRIHRAYNRVREGNFALEGLLGFDMHGSTVGIIGTGKIGALVAKPLVAMGCRVIGYDPFVNPEFEKAGATYGSLKDLLGAADIISLHCPLTPESRHLIGPATLPQMKRGAMVINTSRGALVDTPAVIDALKTGQVGALGIDVYEQEADLFFEDHSDEIIQDDVLLRLLTFPNVLITSHQAFFTETAMRNIADTTVQNLDDFIAGHPSPNEVKPAKIKTPG